MGWWSTWALLLRPSPGSYGFMSKEFPEPLFNRVVFTRPPKHPEESVEGIIGWFKVKGAFPAFFVKPGPSFAPLKEALAAAEYKVADGFEVMELSEPNPGASPDVEIQDIGLNETDLWSRAYLESFYGELSLLPKVKRRVRSTVRRKSNRLLLAKRGKEAVGTMALHTERGYTGLYCLGTVPSMRKRGIAGSLLTVAERHAEQKGTRLILQLFKSDGVAKFYTDRGFRTVYVEEAMIRP